MHTLTETLNAGLLLVQSGHDWDGGGPPWAGRDGGDLWGPWMIFPFLFWIGMLALFAWIVTRLFPRRRDGGAGAAGRRDPAEQILRERFARGEVTAEEYLRSLQILRGNEARAPYGPDSEGETR